MAGPEKRFQDRLRDLLKSRLGWRTWKNVGMAAMPGWPDVTFCTPWGLVGFLEFKHGLPETSGAALGLLKGAQTAVCRELWSRGAPLALVCGDADRKCGTAIFGIGLAPNSLLETMTVDELIDMLDRWARVKAQGLGERSKGDGNDDRGRIAGATEEGQRPEGCC